MTTFYPGYPHTNDMQNASLLKYHSLFFYYEIHNIIILFSYIIECNNILPTFKEFTFQR